jgi:hypothetical protein
VAQTPPGPWCIPKQPPATPEPQHQVIPGLLSTLCSKGWRPILITGLVRDLLARHFAEQANIEETDLAQYFWTNDDKTNIMIESITRWKGDLVEKRPACIIKRNAYQNIRWGISDFVQLTAKGHVHFCTGFAGSHTIFCIHGTGAGAEILSTEVAREIHQFHPVITQYLGLLRWTVTEVGPVAVVEEARQNFVVPVTVGWAYEDNWLIELESLKIRRLPIRASVIIGGV